MGTWSLRERVGVLNQGFRARAKDSEFTYSLHCSSFWGLPYRILLIYLVKPKKGTTMETIGRGSDFDFGSRLVPSTHPSIHLSVYASTSRSTYLCVCPSISLSTHNRRVYDCMLWVWVGLGSRGASSD